MNCDQLIVQREANRFVCKEDSSPVPDCIGEAIRQNSPRCRHVPLEVSWIKIRRKTYHVLAYFN